MNEENETDIMQLICNNKYVLDPISEETYCPVGFVVHSFSNQIAREVWSPVKGGIDVKQNYS